MKELATAVAVGELLCVASCVLGIWIGAALMRYAYEEKT